MKSGSVLLFYVQIDEGVVFNVAGGLLLEHPLTLPFVEAVVSSRVNLGFYFDAVLKLFGGCAGRNHG